MQRITPDRRWPLFDTAATRAIEQAATTSLPPHTLMQRAGLAVARLALAVAPNARTIWVACGPGNNGGDGMEAAMHLREWGKEVSITWSGDEAKTPADAVASLRRVREANIQIAANVPAQWDLAIEAMLGLGSTRPLEGTLAQWATLMNEHPAPVLAVDLPSGLNANTGTGKGSAVNATHTLSLLTLKPGLFTAGGRDASGQVWLDDLGVSADARTPDAWLAGPPAAFTRPHASHKGSYGDVAVIGGAPGMTGAALLAASGALHAGAGRVFTCLLDGGAMTVDTSQPELMLRPWETLDLTSMTVACGCGGGDAVRAALPRILSTAASLVLDADAINAIATDTQLQTLLRARSRRGSETVLTPHPLEAGRLLACSAGEVQSDRLHAARELAMRFECVVVLKGSGTVIAAPDSLPLVNPTGNARLATAGTGDVLAGVIAARIANGASAFDAAASAVFAHGLAADQWPASKPLTAAALSSVIPA
jgi:ADP-dependent NAD(P)H-hydrate dehydratase / NAD(P)H-hydrate epimerase